MTTLSKKERLLLINQYKILASLTKDEKDYYMELIEILENGYSIFYSRIDEWISDDMPIDDSKFVLDILDLYRAIEVLKRSTKDERLKKHDYSYFHGFDGNHETSCMIFCRFLIEKQDKYQEQKPYLLENDNLNSHTPMTNKYNRMLSESRKISDIWGMSPEQALTILNA